MKLGIITAFPPSKVTLNEYGYHLVKHWAAHPEITTIYLYCDTPDAKHHLDFEHSDKIEVVPCWKFNSYRTLSSITKAVKKTKPDHIFLNLQFMKFGDKKIAAALGLCLPKVLRLYGFKNTVLLHNILETVDLSSAGFTNNPLLKKIYNGIGTLLTKLVLQANTVAVTIPKYVAILSKKYRANNVVLVPHGTFDIPETPDFTKNDEIKQVMAFGKFGTYKKVEQLIEAVVKAREISGEQIRLVIAGSDNPNTPGYLKNVEQSYSHVTNLVFTGYLEENEVPRVFKDSTIVAFPYTSTTGSSGVLHQAGSYGKAVVLPNLGDLAELIKEEGYDGVFFDPSNTESLTNALVKLIQDSSLRQQLARKNFKAATAYPMNKIADIYFNIFQKNNEYEDGMVYV